MPTVVTDTPRPSPAEPPRKRWTRQECIALETSGIWAQQHLELIEGELISNTRGKKRPHTNVLIVIQGWLVSTFGTQFVNPETPIDVAPEDNPTNEPEPDIIVLTKPSREFRDNPQPSDLRLVVEISDSTLGFDLTTKARLYARARIVEYWVVDIPGRRIIVHRDPQEGQYRSVVAYSDQETVSPLASPDHKLLVGSAFGE